MLAGVLGCLVRGKRGLGPTYENVEVRELSIVSFKHYGMQGSDAAHTSVG